MDQVAPSHVVTFSFSRESGSPSTRQYIFSNLHCIQVSAFILAPQSGQIGFVMPFAKEFCRAKNSPYGMPSYKTVFAIAEPMTTLSAGIKQIY